MHSLIVVGNNYLSILILKAHISIILQVVGNVLPLSQSVVDADARIRSEGEEEEAAAVLLFWYRTQY